MSISAPPTSPAPAIASAAAPGTLAPSAPALLSKGERVFAAAIALAALSVLVIAWRLNPDPSGINTHTQLGLPACGWMVRFGLPCMTCGMTTSFAHAANGDVLASLRAQPFGFLMCLGTAATVWLAGAAACTGWRLDRFATSVLRGWFLWSCLALGLLAWGYKVWMVKG